VESVLPLVAAVAAASSLAIALLCVWAFARLRGHLRALAAGLEAQQTQLRQIAEHARDAVRETERRGAAALAESLAALAADRERRDRVRVALDEVLSSAAAGRLQAEPGRVLVARLQEIDRELLAAASR
jgi:hypothetical protein